VETPLITAIFDGNYMLHRCMRQGQLAEMATSRGEATGGIFGSLRTIRKELMDLAAHRCIVVFDGGISKRRRAIYEPYKGARARPLDSDYYEEKSDKDLEYRLSFTKQLIHLQALLPHLGIITLQFDGWEADDICYRVARHYFEQQDSAVWLVSDDKDYLQAVDLREIPGRSSIGIVRPIARETVTVANFYSMVGHRREHHLFWRAIEGDSSDKIKGVYGVGAGRLMTLFSEYQGIVEYPFEEILFYCMSHRSKVIRKIYEDLDVVLRNYELLDFESEPFNEETRSMLELALQRPVLLNRHLTREALHYLEMSKMLREYSDWLLPFRRIEDYATR
jgi:DNA polymerase I